jgi:hypothetical protein
MAADEYEHKWALLLPLIPIQLSEDQWHAIVRPSGLPSEARPYIGRAIAMYQVFDTTRRRSQTAAETRAALDDAQRHALSLHRRMTELLNNPRALIALTLALDPPREFTSVMGERTAQIRTTKAIAEIASFAQWFATAQQRVAKSRPGAREKAMQLQLFVTVLDQILMQFTGNAIDRSSKGPTTRREYISAVCRIADPTIRPSSIEEAMKRQIKSRGKISR